MYALYIHRARAIGLLYIYILDSYIHTRHVEYIEHLCRLTYAYSILYSKKY